MTATTHDEESKVSGESAGRGDAPGRSPAAPGVATVLVLAPDVGAAREEAILGAFASRGASASIRDTRSGRVVVVRGRAPEPLPPEVVRSVPVRVPGPAVALRRRLLDGFAGAVASGFLGLLLIVALAFVAPPEGGPARVEEAEAGLVAELDRSGYASFHFGRDPGFVVHEGERLLAVSAICPSHGCRVEWDGLRREFHCAHARFGPDGRVVSGSSRPLASYAVSVEGDRILVRRSASR